MINHQHHKATGGQQENRDNTIDSIPSVTGATSPRPVRKISRPPNALQSPLSSMESPSIATLPSLFTFEDGRGATGTRELERLLRIAKRDNQVLMVFFISPVFLVSFGSSITT